MARITTGPIISDIRGKSGDQIFSRNRYGLYVKAFAVPTGTPSAAMELVRTRMAAVTAAWQALTESNRQRWISTARALNAKAKRFPRETLTGYALFTRCQMHRLTAGLSQSTTPTAITALPIFSVEPNFNAPSGVEAEAFWQRGSTGWRAMIYGSAAFSAARYSPNVSPYKFVGFDTWSANNDPVNILLSGDYPEVWDVEELTNDAVYFWRVLPVNIGNGQIAPPSFIRTQITDG